MGTEKLLRVRLSQERRQMQLLVIRPAFIDHVLYAGYPSRHLGTQEWGNAHRLHGDCVFVGEPDKHEG